MPERRTIEQARRAKREGKRPTTQAGAFVAEEMRHVKTGKHGAGSRRQAIAIGLSKARRAGVKLPAPGPGRAKPKTRRSAESALRRGERGPLASGSSGTTRAASSGGAGKARATSSRSRGREASRSRSSGSRSTGRGAAGKRR